jgi:hypothetical protein
MNIAPSRLQACLKIKFDNSTPAVVSDGLYGIARFFGLSETCVDITFVWIVQNGKTSLGEAMSFNNCLVESDGNDVLIIKSDEARLTLTNLCSKKIFLEIKRRRFEQTKPK